MTKKVVKEGKIIITDLRGIVMEEGVNFWDMKLEMESDNQDSKKITKAMEEVHQKIQYQNELIRETSAFLYTERRYVKDNFKYIRIIGSNSKVPEIQKNFEEVGGYISAGLDEEEKIKDRLKKTDSQLSNIDKMFTSI